MAEKQCKRAKDELETCQQKILNVEAELLCKYRTNKTQHRNFFFSLPFLALKNKFELCEKESIEKSNQIESLKSKNNEVEEL
jgi:hypothetical protein